MSFSFNEQNLESVASLKKRYPDSRALVLPLLWLAQKQESYLSEEAMGVIAEIITLPYMHIYSVATFYTMFRLEPTNKRIVEVCRTLSCELNGSEKIKQHLDENFSDEYEILEVECMGACSGAPMCTIDGKYMENVTPQILDEVLDAN